MEDNIFREESIRTFNNLDIHYACRNDPGSYVTGHWHDAIEIIYIIDGIAEVMLRQKYYIIRKGEFLLINARVVHSSKNTYGNRGIVIQIPMDILRKYLPDADDVIFDVPLNSDEDDIQNKLEQLKQLIMDMGEPLRNKEDGYVLKFNSLIYEFLYELYKNFSYRTRSLQKNLYKEEDRLSQVISYTQKHYAEHIRIRDVASIIYLQPEYFCRFFKKAMGVTYLEYLNEYRLSHVYQDLIDTDLPLNQILQKHGFTNYKLFRRLFNERFQCTPMQLREQRKKNLLY